MVSKTLYLAPLVYYGIQYENVGGYVNFWAQLYAWLWVCGSRWWCRELVRLCQMSLVTSETRVPYLVICRPVTGLSCVMTVGQTWRKSKVKQKLVGYPTQNFTWGNHPTHFRLYTQLWLVYLIIIKKKGKRTHYK